jgi:hypothetical protein
MNYSMSGLETLTININSAGVRPISGKIQLPVATDGNYAASQVVCVVKQNGTTIFTSKAGADGFGPISMNNAANDSIQVILSSSLASDEVLNAVRAVISVG